MSEIPDSTAQTLQPPSWSQVRQELEDLVLRDLLGPACGPDEEIDETKVSGRYLVGWLAPRNVGRSTEAAKERAQEKSEKFERGESDLVVSDDPLDATEEDERLAVAGADSTEEGLSDDPTVGSESMLPNAVGMTFCLAAGVEEIQVRAAWGWYRRRKSETGFKTKKGDDKTVWYRTPIEGEGTVRIVEGPIEPIVPFEDVPQVQVRGRVDKCGDGSSLVTLFLVNDQDGSEGARDDTWLFQTELRVWHPEHQPCFSRRRSEPTEAYFDAKEREDNEETRVMYRKRAEFAVGHGVAVDWKVSNDPHLATMIWTTAVPRYEVAKSRPRQIGGLETRMIVLAQAKHTELPSLLTPLVDEYRGWIDEEEKKIGLAEHKLDDSKAQSAARRIIARARQSADRIEAGIQLIKADKNAYQAFVFANEAMHHQRLHSILSQKVRRGDQVKLEEVKATEDPRWYPFQLAFMLVNLPSLTDLGHPERREKVAPQDPGPTAELLWFPTGGGKTEAYLGLTAYTLAIRRLQGIVEGRRGDEGVAVLMRYTLRLLTLQQFQRATALICACELLRERDVETWGETPFRIGLWVGQKSTPNSYEAAADSLQSARNGGYAGGIGSTGTLRQLTNCPWCGKPIAEGKDIVPDAERRRILTFCSDPFGGCAFSRKKRPTEGLPICVVDEEIYRLLPSLVIATVDKFAQMPWNGEVGMLFGKVTNLCGRHGFLCPSSKHGDPKNPTTSHRKTEKLPAATVEPHGELRPPDLIIQDELHLITGPLGSLVGIYETAVDELCAWTVGDRRVRPKVVVSTATIRRAGDQVSSLFMRSLEVFPPRGIEAEDNYFAEQLDVSEHNPGLRYVGICGSGRRLKVSLIRVYVACMCAAQTLYEKYGKLVDPYMTTVGYFSSIRELGGMRRLLDDDIRTRMQQMDKRGLARRSYRGGYEELTSRKSAADIPTILDWLEADFDPEKEAQREQERKDGKRERSTKAPLDALIATNMISVGVDVPRLGLMIVAGQPKMTAEYIQATSRVGRRHPGLVFTVHNWARPRDLSHFETFTHFHATFHMHVESPSVTPFAPGARERALSGVLASLVRLQGPERNSEQGADRVLSRDEIVKKAIGTLIARAENVETAARAAEVKAEVDRRVDVWIKRASDQNLVYKKGGDFDTPLLHDADGSKWDTFTALNSLREVEPSSNLVLLEFNQAVPERLESDDEAPEDAVEEVAL